MKLDRGCEKDTAWPTWTDIKGNRRSRCPRRPLLEESEFFNWLIVAYNQYDKGFLPNVGGLCDQHAKFPILMDIIYSTMLECDKVEQQKREARERIVI